MITINLFNVSFFVMALVGFILIFCLRIKFKRPLSLFKWSFLFGTVLLLLSLYLFMATSQYIHLICNTIGSVMTALYLISIMGGAEES
ncbi:hypothetical protein MKX72_15575 [Priestia sp. FSL R5-0597]|uniref:hypothetical protein n=1 Tax=Priestia TaxID=2800373 RepID=UPI0012B76D84|nr:hypothetical protein [Priestia megaterium]